VLLLLLNSWPLRLSTAVTSVYSMLPLPQLRPLYMILAFATLQPIAVKALTRLGLGLTAATPARIALAVTHGTACCERTYLS
jgi:hypothetical protein